MTVCGCQISFLHNILAIVFVRVPRAYLMSALFPSTLFPMGLATAMGSLLSVAVCIIVFAVLQRKMAKSLHKKITKIRKNILTTNVG